MFVCSLLFIILGIICAQNDGPQCADVVYCCVYYIQGVLMAAAATTTSGFVSLAVYTAAPATPAPSTNRLLVAAIEKENGDEIAKLLSRTHPSGHAIGAAGGSGGANASAASATAVNPPAPPPTADVNTVDPITGKTPLIVAVCHNSFAMCSLLLTYGADPNLRSGSQFFGGSTPLHIAARADTSTKLAELLIEAGADVNARDALTGATPLIEAAKRGSHAVIVALGKHSADSRLVDRFGWSPQYYAKKAGHTAIAERLPVVAFDTWAAISKHPEFQDNMKAVLASVKKKPKKVKTDKTKKKY